MLDQSYEPSATYLKVQSTEKKIYLLRYDEEADEWTLQSGFDGDELLVRSSITLITIDAEVIRPSREGNRILRALSSWRCRDSVRLAFSRSDWTRRRC